MSTTQEELVTNPSGTFSTGRSTDSSEPHLNTSGVDKTSLNCTRAVFQHHLNRLSEGSHITKKMIVFMYVMLFLAYFFFRVSLINSASGITKIAQYNQPDCTLCGLHNCHLVYSSNTTNPILFSSAGVLYTIPSEQVVHTTGPNVFPLYTCTDQNHLPQKVIIPYTETNSMFTNLPTSYLDDKVFDCEKHAGVFNSDCKKHIEESLVSDKRYRPYIPRLDKMFFTKQETLTGTRYPIATFGIPKVQLSQAGQDLLDMRNRFEHTLFDLHIYLFISIILSSAIFVKIFVKANIQNKSLDCLRVFLQPNTLDVANKEDLCSPRSGPICTDSTEPHLNASGVDTSVSTSNNTAVGTLNLVKDNNNTLTVQTDTRVSQENNSCNEHKQ